MMRSTGSLDAVIGGVAQDVGQRIAHDLDELAVELGVASVDDERELLLGLAGQFADQARQAREQRLSGCMRARITES